MLPAAACVLALLSANPGFVAGPDAGLTPDQKQLAHAYLEVIGRTLDKPAVAFERIDHPLLTGVEVFRGGSAHDGGRLTYPTVLLARRAGQVFWVGVGPDWDRKVSDDPAVLAPLMACPLPVLGDYLRGGEPASREAKKSCFDLGLLVRDAIVARPPSAAEAKGAALLLATLFTGHTAAALDKMPDVVDRPKDGPAKPGTWVLAGPRAPFRPFEAKGNKDGGITATGFVTLSGRLFAQIAQLDVRLKPSGFKLRLAPYADQAFAAR